MKVFWSWQADLDPRLHQYLVRDALRDACDRLAAAAKVDGPLRPEVDHDTLGMSGTPDIVTGILRKIETAAVFIADMTPIGTTDPAALRPGTPPDELPPIKHLQNPNVMSELGYADRAIGQDRIILVANSARYPGPEALPFDWRHRRGPLLYTLADGATPAERRAVRNELTERFTAYLTPILAQVAAQQPAPPSLLAQQPSATDAALWEGAEDGISFNESLIHDERKTARLPEGPRLYVRLAPEGWTQQPRHLLMERMDRHEVKLWIGSGSGSSGSNGAGAFAASGIHAEDGGYSARGVTQWFASNGEIWGIDTSAFGRAEEGDDRPFAYRLPFPYLGRFLREAIGALRSFVPEGRIEIELGAAGLLASSLPGEYRGHRTPALADRVDVRDTASDWSSEKRNALLFRFWNELMDAYGQRSAPDLEAFERAAGVQLERGDSDD